MRNSTAPAFMARTLIGMSPWPVMKMTGRAMPAFTSSSWNASPLLPGSRTSSTRQPGASGRSAPQEFLRRGEGAHLEPDRADEVLERAAHRVVVVDHEYDGPLGAHARALTDGKRKAEGRTVRLLGFTHSCPPCASTIERLMESPMPSPSGLVV